MITVKIMIFLKKGLDFGQLDKSSHYYYISHSACQLGVITNKVVFIYFVDNCIIFAYFLSLKYLTNQKLLGFMAIENPEIYNKLKTSFFKDQNHNIQTKNTPFFIGPIRNNKKNSRKKGPHIKKIHFLNKRF